MKKTVFISFLSVLLLNGGCREDEERQMKELIDKTMAIAANQALSMAKKLEYEEGRLPRTLDNEGKLLTETSRWWTAGFFPGTLWYVYEYTGDKAFLRYADLYTSRVEREQYTTWHHDLGFMIFCSFGNKLRLSPSENTGDVIVQAARSLSTRYRPKAEAIQSWNSRDSLHWPVIIDNMMNLELLTWASRHTGEQTFKEIAVRHANKTIKEFFREDGSSYHIVAFDSITGGVQLKGTVQGAANESAWARGQSWGFYGYTMMYRETGERQYLEQALKIADFLLHHPNMPSDMIPYVDYDAPEIPYANRDASAGAIMASALVELSTLVEDDRKALQFKKAAQTQIKSLASENYLARPGENGNFILMHSVGSYGEELEQDKPLTYADYYFVEAMLRYKKAYIDN